MKLAELADLQQKSKAGQGGQPGVQVPNYPTPNANPNGFPTPTQPNYQNPIRTGMVPTVLIQCFSFLTTLKISLFWEIKGI